MKRILTALLVACCLNMSAQKRQMPDTQQILSVLAAQQSAWNRADLAGFMEGYWKSDSLSFIGKRGITKGWNATLANYRKSYPGKAAMGNLSFDVITLELLGPSSAYMVGSWKLERAKGSVGGYFTLLWKKIGRRWQIVSDHSS